MWDRSEGNSIFLTDWSLSHQILDYSDGNSMTWVTLAKSQVGALGAMMKGAVTMDSIEHFVWRRKGGSTSGGKDTLGRLSGVRTRQRISYTVVNTRDVFDSEGVTLQENTLSNNNRNLAIFDPNEVTMIRLK